jgi:hypothetical protein
MDAPTAFGEPEHRRVSDRSALYTGNSGYELPSIALRLSDGLYARVLRGVAELTGRLRPPRGELSFDLADCLRVGAVRDHRGGGCSSNRAAASFACTSTPICGRAATSR